MDYAVFRGFLQRAANGIPRLGKFLDGLDNAEATRNNATEAGYENYWLDLFKRAEIRLDDAEHGLDRVASGKAKYKTAEDILPLIYSEAKGFAEWKKSKTLPAASVWWSTPESATREFACNLCQGSGVIRAWHPTARRLARVSPVEFSAGNGPWQFSMLCFCDNKLRHEHIETMVPYCQDMIAVLPGVTPDEERADLIARLTRNYADNPDDLMSYINGPLPDWHTPMEPQRPQEEGGGDWEGDSWGGRLPESSDEVAASRTHTGVFLPPPIPD